MLQGSSLLSDPGMIKVTPGASCQFQPNVAPLEQPLIGRFRVGVKERNRALSDHTPTRLRVNAGTTEHLRHGYR